MTALARRWEAALLLAGTIVGVGIFGIPFVFSMAGFWAGVALLVLLTAASTLVHLAYLEIVFATPTIHRLPGYAQIYLGFLGGKLASLSYLVSITGALVAYLILGGSFLQTLVSAVFGSTPVGVGHFFFTICGAFVIFRNIRIEGAVNGILTVLLVLTLVAFSITLVPAIDIRLLSGFRLDSLSLPYGVILFALSGAAVIPELFRLIGIRERRDARHAVILGTILPALLYLCFATTVIGASHTVSSDAITGIADRFGRPYYISGSLIGFLACITSFIGLGMVLEGMFMTDFGVSRKVAPWLAIGAPVALALSGVHDYIAVIAFVGAVAIGFEGVVTMLIYDRVVSRGVRAASFLSISIRRLLILLFLVGMATALINFSSA